MVRANFFGCGSLAPVGFRVGKGKSSISAIDAWTRTIVILYQVQRPAQGESSIFAMRKLDFLQWDAVSHPILTDPLDLSIPSTLVI